MSLARRLTVAAALLALPGPLFLYAPASAAEVSVTAPSPASGTVAVTVRSANNQISRVEIYIDDVQMSSCPKSPCSYRWDTTQASDGPHALQAKRIDKAGVETSSPVLTVAVQNAGQPDVTPPSVTLTAPSTASGTVTISASASDASGIVAVKLYLDGGLLGTYSTATVTIQWDSTSVADGSHTWQARAEDPSGNVGDSQTLSVVVSNSGGDRTPPGAPSGLERLLGPVTPVGVPSPNWWIAAYDTLQLTQGEIYAESFPAESTIAGSNFYDLALALYHIYYRTGDVYWQGKARVVARAWRDDPVKNYIARYLQGDWSVGSLVPPPRDLSTLGLAVLALETNDAEARRVVDLHARYVTWTWVGYRDLREAAYTLMALVGSTVLGDDHAAAARQQLDFLLGWQKANGQWEDDPDSLVPVPYTLNYMMGLLMEALMLYDRAIGDPRIAPAVQRGVDWLWSTQWVSSAQAFQYANVTAGTVHTGPAPVLSGLLIPAWGYVWAKTGDIRYRGQGDQILQAISRLNATYIVSAKQFAQVFRSSSQYVGYTGAQ